jgi:Tol biopolymer transport system component
MTPAASEHPVGLRLSDRSGFAPGLQRSELTVVDRHGTGRQVIYETLDHIEAPNWSPDGAWLLFNSAGRLFRLRADGSSAGPVPIQTDLALAANNDHVLSPDGRTIYVSVKGGHVYAVPWEGGRARRISNVHPETQPHLYFVHGISPDGSTLVYVAIRGSQTHRQYGLYTIPVEGGPDTALFQPTVPVDGPEYAPDGRWIYYNAEHPSRAAGHAQIYRMRPDGSGIEQITHDERVNWFPHLSPDGAWLACISYPAGTLGHPANRDVLLRVMRPDGSEPGDIVALLGGQGTLNVNSWAPDSQRLAYVAYPALG